jgi:hypothetical protein
VSETSERPHTPLSLRTRNERKKKVGQGIHMRRSSSGANHSSGVSVAALGGGAGGGGGGGGKKTKKNTLLSILALLFATTVFATFFHGHRRVGEAFDESLIASSSSSSSLSRRHYRRDDGRDRTALIVDGEDKDDERSSSSSSSSSSSANDENELERQREKRQALDKETEEYVAREQKRLSSPPAPIASSSSSSSSSRRRNRRSGPTQQQAEFTLEHVGPKGTSEVRPNGRCVSSGGDEKERKVWRRLESVDDPLFIRVTGAYYDPARTRNKPKTRSLIMHRSMFEPGVRVVKIDRNGERVEPGSRSGVAEDSGDNGTEQNSLLMNKRSGNSWQDEMTRRVGTSEDEEIILDFRGDLVEQLPREDEDHKEFSFGTCAIVGNSGAILGKGYGKEIDEKDAVWRVNYAPIDGFEKDVGYRTTFDLINQQHTKRFVRGDGEYSEEDEDDANNDVSSQTEETAEVDESKPKVILKNGRGAKHASKRNSTLMVFEVTSNYARKHLYARLMRQRTNKGLKIWSPELVVHAQRSWDVLSHLTAQKMGTSKTGKAMSGAYAVILASQICEEVHLYGFSPYKRRDVGQAVPYHYFDEIPAVLKHHSFDLAIEVFKTIRDWPCSGVRLEIHP